MNEKTKKWVYAGIAILMICVVGFASASAQMGGSSNRDSESSEGVDEKLKTETKTETKTEEIPYTSSTVEDGNLEYGKTQVRTAGVKGKKTITYEVVYENGKEVSRQKTGEEVTQQPVNEVIANGTKVVWHCSDATSYDKNPYNDNYCVSSTGQAQYVSDSQAIGLDPSYAPGKSGHYYYNSK